MFYIDKINDKKIIKSTLINTNHCFTTKDLCLKSDEIMMKDLIYDNEKDICKYFNIDVNQLIFPNQVHSSNINVVQNGIFNYPETDALIINNNDIAIGTYTADCVPIIIYDDKKKIGAVVHAGWKGTVEKILPKTINKLINEHNCNINDIRVAIGPAIGICCYEINQQICNQLKDTVVNFYNLYRITDYNTIYVDLKNINARQIFELGITNIDISTYCTSCNNNFFYSYRKECKTSNRNCSILKIV